MRHGAHVFAIGIVVANNPLIIGAENGIQRCGALGGQKLPVKAVCSKLSAVGVDHIGRVKERVEAKAHQAGFVGSQRVCLQCVLHAAHHVSGQRAAIDVITSREDKAQDSGLVSNKVMQTHLIAVAVQHLAVRGYAHGGEAVAAGLGCDELQWRIARCQHNRRFVLVWSAECGSTPRPNQQE